MSNEIINELFPSNDEILAVIRDLTQWGHRKTGTPEGAKSAEYIRAKMQAFGLEDIEIERTPSNCMFVDRYALSIGGRPVECFYANGTNRQRETGSFNFNPAAEPQSMVYLGKGSDEDFKDIDVRGKVVVCDIDFLESDPISMAKWSEETIIYDPNDRMKGIRKYDIYSPNNWPYNYFTALAEGAVGFVGILNNYSDDPYWYNEDYTEIGSALGHEYMAIPAVWISRSSGSDIVGAYGRGVDFEGVLQMNSRYEYRDALNVRGIVPGESDDIILVHSHHDAVFDGAVQDASGTAEMLALAKYFAGSVNAKPKKTLMFAATDTHYTDYMGHQGFIKKRKEDGDNIIYDFAIEHIGKEVELTEDGEFVETGEAETRVMYVTKKGDMVDRAVAALAKYGIEKVIVLPVDFVPDDGKYVFKQDEVISDAYYFERDGIPVVSILSGPMYLFHPSDKLERVMATDLNAIGSMYAELIGTV